MENRFFHRLSLLTGNETTSALQRSHVIVFGLGGVGSWCAEALVRSGIGSISLVDNDSISVTNINRQLQATSKNIGLEKAGELEKRLLEINPSCAVRSFPMVFSKETAEHFDISQADFIIDAIDTLPDKLDLIEIAHASDAQSAPVEASAYRGNFKSRHFFSSMGMAQKLDPTLIKTADIWESAGCPLARLVRQGLKNRNFTGHFTVVYSSEKLLKRDGAALEETGKKPIGSFVSVTAAAGMVLASLVVRDLYSRYSLQTNE